jgi:predicted ATPase
MSSSQPRFLRSVSLANHDLPEGYPFDLPAVRGLGTIEFAPVTTFVGDNGSGKSTLIEAIAVACGFNAEGGGRNLRFETYATHSELSSHLTVRFRKRPAWGWFLRAETFYGMASHIASDDHPDWGVKSLFPDLHGRSHGESFLELMGERFLSAGLYVMDEPESALSFHGQLQLMVIMNHALANGSQFIMATHSPLLMRFPRSRILSFDGDPINEVGYDDLDVVQLWRRFLDSPDAFLSALLDDHGD